MLLPLSRVLNSRAALVAPLLLACLLNGCGDPPTIHADGNLPATFTFSGSSFAEYRHLHFFFVTEVASDKMIWQIWPDTYANGDVEHLPIITYGKVPSGWTQKIPEHGEPPSLVEGKVYEAGGPPSDSHLAYMRFTIRDGKFVTLPLHDDQPTNSANANKINRGGNITSACNGLG